MIISSQRYINEALVTAKIEDQDFELLVSPAFDIDGMTVRVLLDGHHSLAASKAAGVAPIVVVADSTDHDAVALIESGDAEGFLSATHMGDDYYDVKTGEDVW